MKRKEFLYKFGVGTAALTVCNCMIGCSSEDDVTGTPPPPANVDFTLDLNDAANSALNNNGGSVYRGSLLVGRVNATIFIAVSQVCTHQGTIVQFQLSSNRIHCPNHGSNFNFDGAVINGPATQPLRKYNTELSGSLLRVFS
jgi:cytochrome b6-f complex iron-sulfur subunit